MASFLRHIRYAVRVLLKQRSYTLVALATLSVGVGINICIFGALNSVFLRQLPVDQPNQLVALGTMQRGHDTPSDFSYLDFKDVQEETKKSKIFSDVFGYVIDFSAFSADQHSERVLVTYTTGNYFTALGLRPSLGRLLLPSEGEKSGADNFAVLSYAFWKRRFAGDEDVIGKSVYVDNHLVTVVGIAPEDFRGVFSMAQTDVFLPLNSIPLHGCQCLDDRKDRSLRVLARLAPGANLEKARSNLDVVAHRLAQQNPLEDMGMSIVAYPERIARPQPSAARFWVMAFSMSISFPLIVLLVACFNLTNLLLIQGTVKKAELGIRAALGAQKRDLVVQSLTETTLLSLVGSALGLGAGWLALKTMGGLFVPPDVPMLRPNLVFDWHILLYVLILTAITMIIGGTVPAIAVWRTDLLQALHDRTQWTSSGRKGRKLQHGLVTAQVAGSMILLIVAALYSRSLRNAVQMDLGFEPANIINLSLDTKYVDYTIQQEDVFYKQLLAKTSTMPGVESAAYSYSVPFGSYQAGAPVYLESSTPNRRPKNVFYNRVSPEYFSTLKIPLLEGRQFTEQDTEASPRVAIISETMGKSFWRDQDPIGKRFRMESAISPWITVIGVARDTKFWNPFQGKLASFYVPLQQSHSTLRVLQVRTHPGMSVQSISTSIKQEVENLAPRLPVFDVRTMQESLEGANGFFIFRIGVILATTLGILSLFLVGVGVYGIVSYSVQQRQREIAIRRTLGANNAQIMGTILRQSLWTIGIGLLVGLGVAFPVGHAMAVILLQVSPNDPIAYGAAAGILALLAFLASYVPARAALKMDPATSLRIE